MNQGSQEKQVKRRFGPGRTIAGCLLGAGLALFAPVLLATEITSLLPVLQLPSIGLLLILCLAGRGAAVCSGMLLVLFAARKLGGTFAWVMVLSAILPLSFMIRRCAKPFFSQMKSAVAAYTAGMVASVCLLYASYGGNLIERAMLLLPQAARSLPPESIGSLEEIFRAGGLFGSGAEFLDYFETLIQGMVPVYEMNLPGLLFSGAVLTGVINVWIIGRIRRSRLPGVKDTFVPICEWSLPSSTSIGVLLMMIVSYALYAVGYGYGQGLYYAVYNIAVAVFCLQAFTSFARIWSRKSCAAGAKIALVIAVAGLCLSGLTIAIAVYGCASAMFGRFGVIRTHFIVVNKHHDDDEEN